MTCSNCGTENEAGRKYCKECGQPLAVQCPVCGAANSVDAKFCGECGSPLVPGQAAQASAATPMPLVKPVEPATERRLVSILFADLVGFTTISETRDSEEVRDLLSRYFDACRTVIARYGGTVEKFIGDAVMAVWGTPVAQEDDAERAVRAALDLVEGVPELGKEVGAPNLQARAGVLTGEATVNLGTAGQGMVAGDLVNTASRIQSVAEAGTVLVGEGTKRATDTAVAYQDAGTHELKGKAEPVRLYRALRVTAGRRGLMKSEGLEAPFVGRERELRLVKDLFHVCVDEGKAHLVRVSGIAGIGKSRLSWELLKYADGLQRRFLWHRGRCLAYGEGVTYWALAEMVRGRAGILEGEDRTSAATKLHETVERHVPDPDDRRFVEPRLAHLLSLEDRTAPDKSDLFAGWRLFFERLAASDPVIMLFEDLQWADPSLVEFIDHLLEWSRNVPIFVLTLARPETSATPPGAKRNATSIYLEPLSAEAMERLLTGLVPGLPEEITRKILERAEGVPLYAVETVRMLLDRGLLVQEGPAYRPSGAIGDLEVPETLHALIAARLDGLGPEERALVQNASVVGKTFTRQALASLSGLPERDLEPLLASLVAKEVLSVQADPRSPERGQFGFLQELVRTIAYETLSKRDRRERHLRVASYLEQAWGAADEVVEVTASHYLEAYRLAPDADDANEIKDRARRMLGRAAERAASLAAAEEAQAYFEQAAELADSALERAELTERAGQMAVLRGRAEDGWALFEQAIRLFEAAGQSHQAARVQGRLAEVEFLQGNVEQSLERMRAAYGVLSGDEPDPDLALVAAQLGRFLALSGRTAEAVLRLEEALGLSEQLELREVYSHALSSRAVALLRPGRLHEAKILLREALNVALEDGFTGAAQRAYTNLTVLLVSLDRFAETLELGREALAFNQRAGDRVSEMSMVGLVADLLVRLGRWDEALAAVEEAKDMGALSSLQWAILGLLAPVPVHLGRGMPEVASAILEQRAALGDSENLEIRSYYGAVRSEWLRAVGRQADALAVALVVVNARDELGLAHPFVKGAFVQAVESALDLGDDAKAEELLSIVERARPGEVTPLLRAHAARLAAKRSIGRGETDDVEAGFLAAERGYRDLGMPFDMAVALLEHAEWLLSQGRGSEAPPLLDEAAEVFGRLQATPWLERTARLAGTGQARAPVG